ncbi:MAG: 50S ribosomal protein L25 [Chloroflexi bacterium]|nr:MAG: 50S ribosomal protein L25 [Chloroflexota bacterium]
MNQQAKQVQLAAEKRTVLGKQVRQLRQQGLTPGVIYGHGFDAVPVQFETQALHQVLSHVGGSQLIGIKIQDEDKGHMEMALVRDVQRDPIRRTLLHVDFYRVDMTERLTTEVPLEMVGESPIVEAREGIMLQGISSIEVECLPGDLVDAIEVDLSELVELDQGIYVRDLAIPAGIDLITDPDEMIVRVVPLVGEEELEELLEVEEEELLVPEAPEIEVVTEAEAEAEAEAEELAGEE